MISPPDPSANPFSSYSRSDAERYEAWYHTPAGRVVASEEQAALAAMLAVFPAQQTVLEVGCGSGYFTRWLAARGHTVVGIDQSPEMLAVAHTFGGASYVLATGEALPFADASFDVVVFITALEFIAAPITALQEAARVARAGIVLGVLNLSSPLGIRRKLTAWFQPSIYRTAHFYTIWGLRRLVWRALPGRVQHLQWTTTLSPRGVPRSLHRLPCGAFIVMAVQLA